MSFSQNSLTGINGTVVHTFWISKTLITNVWNTFRLRDFFLKGHQWKRKLRWDLSSRLLQKINSKLLKRWMLMLIRRKGVSLNICMTMFHTPNVNKGKRIDIQNTNRWNYRYEDFCQHCQAKSWTINKMPISIEKHAEDIKTNSQMHQFKPQIKHQHNASFSFLMFLPRKLTDFFLNVNILFWYVYREFDQCLLCW